MTTFLRCRNYREGESFPYVLTNDYKEDEVFYHPCDETLYEFWQPDEIEDMEFGSVILLNGRPVLVINIDFDFVEVEV